MRKRAMRALFIGVSTLGLVGWVAVEQGMAQSDTQATPATVVQQGRITVLTAPNTKAAEIDFINAQPMKLPRAPGRLAAEAQEDLISALTAPLELEEAWFEAGAPGNGRRKPVWLGVPNAVENEDEDEITPQEFGTTNHPFSTARADLSSPTNTFYPYRASGKLFFNQGTSTFVCSASLIKRGVVVTAAHCVSEFGKNQFYTNFSFVPGYRDGAAPFGKWKAQKVFVLTAYLKGTDPCSTAGVVCKDDIAVILLKPSRTGAYPGTATGWYGYGWNNFGFTTTKLIHISQIGYPVCLDNGQFMERNDSHGFQSAAQSNNTLIGSLMCGGSSGGPWLVNFGLRPTLTATTPGTAPDSNVVVGVTSWGFTNTAPKQQGASPFLSTNVVPLVKKACTLVPAACA